MKKMRVLSVIVAAAISLAALSACGGAKKEATQGTVTSSETAKEEANTAGTITEEMAEEEAEEESEKIAEETDADEEAPGIGKTTNSTYRNEFFGIEMTVDENWIFATEEEMQQINALVSEALTDTSAIGEVMKDALDSGSTYQDMIVNYADGSASANVTIGKMSFMELAYAKRGTLIEDIVSSSGADMEELYESAYGMENVEVSVGETTFCGEKVPAMVTKASVQGIPVFMKQVYVVKGSYNATVTASSYFDDFTDDVMELFTSAD